MDSTRILILATFISGFLAISVFLVLVLSRGTPEHMHPDTAVPSSAAPLSQKTVSSTAALRRLALQEPNQVTPARIGPPPELASFWDWSPEQRLAAVTDLQTTPNLPSGVRLFFASAIKSQEIDETTRNNIANALTNQVPQDPRLAALFVAMVRDPSESYQWREYALQHVAVIARTSTDRQLCIQLLWEQFHAGERGIPGTAALHLHRLDTDGVIALERAYADELVKLMLDEEADLLVRMTAIGICSERQEMAALEAIRHLAKHPTPSVRRVAIAALGTLGERVDHAVLVSALADADPTVSFAATGALETYSMRTTSSSPGNPSVIPE